MIGGTTGAVGAYYHYFGVHAGGSAISGNSLGLSFYQSSGSSLYSTFGTQFTSCSYDTRFDLKAYRSISTTGYENIEVSFNWKCNGELWNGTWYDYGQVGYSLNGGSSFTWLTTGGPNNDGLYHSRTSTQSATVSFPAIVDDNTNFVLAFRAKADECGGNQPAFIIDNIVVSGDALSGPPSCATPISPSDEASGHSLSAPLEWNSVANADEYKVYIGTNTNPTHLVATTANTYYTPSSMNYNTTYYWKIVPTNTGGDASGCSIWSFTTGAAPPQFHNYGGSEQLTFNNSAYKVDAPNFRISHSTSTMDEVQIQISQDVTFSGTTIYDGTFTGSFSGENNFETSLSGDVLDNTEFPQPFDTDILTHGTSDFGQTNIWFAPEYREPIAYEASGGNPGGRVGYSGAWNNYWGNYLRLPEVDATGMDEITLSFDVWHSYFDTHPNDKLYLSAYADGGYVDLPQTVKIDGATVTASANIGSSGYAFYFSEERDASNIEVAIDISGLTDKSSILLYLNPSCGYNDNKDFSVYFDNISVTGADQEFTPGTTYYARARGKVGGSWTDWTSDTYSFTYKDQASIEWHQTAEPQLQTNTLSDVITLTESSNEFATIEETVPPANPFENHSFETSGDWDTYVTGGSELEITLSDGGNWQSDGSKAARMYMWSGYAMSSDVAIISQTVDLTDVEQITFDAYSHYGQNMSSSLANGGTLRLIIGGTSSNTTGTVYETINHCVSGSSSCSVESLDNVVTIDPADRGANKLVKFVWTGFTQGDLGGALVSFQVDNIRVGDAPNPPGTADGTVTSTPINLSSFYGDDSWDELSWDQTLNGGSISMTIEEDISGTWTPVAGLTDVSEIGDGAKTIDISSLGSASRIRLITEFSESGAKGTQPELNNWTITTKKDTPLPVTLLYFDVQCNGHSKEFSWATASEINSDYFLIMESQDNVNFKPIGKIQAAGQSYETKDYRYVIEGLSDDAYYRLKQVDFDGSSESFSMIYNSCEQDNELEISVYPNPFNGNELNVLSSDHLGESQIKIYDTSGRVIRAMQTDFTQGINTIRFENVLAPGAYYLEIENNTTRIKQISVIVN